MCLPICCPDTNRSWPMYDRRAVNGGGSSALYATTGMPADSAFAIGEVNACGSISEVAIPSAFAVTAELMALTIWPTLLESEPVQLYEQPSNLHASAAPLCVGVKNTFVVTWLTNVK